MSIPRIRVAYILTPITFGGAEKVSLNFLRTVNRERFDIQPVLLIRPWDDELYFEQELRELGYVYEKVPVALTTDGDPMRVARVAQRLLIYMKNGAFDLVHTHGYFADICGQFAARLLGIKGVSTCHGFIYTDLKLRLYNLLDKYCLRLCKKVIAVSDGIKSELIESGIRDTRISVIANAVSLSSDQATLTRSRQEKRRLLGIGSDEFVIGYLGRLSVEKGLAYLIEAACESLNGTRIKLVIIGDGPERQALEQQAQSRGIAESVIFVGFQPNPESWHPAFDLFVLPSLTEGTPLALLESMSAGVPVIASAVGGVPKIVTDGVNGILLPPGDPKAIKEQVQFLAGNPDFAYRIGRAGRELIKANYSVDRWCRAIEDCYSSVR
jgi:glycosyltransferase involved in cell wall biosynthesis